MASVVCLCLILVISLPGVSGVLSAEGCNDSPFRCKYYCGGMCVQDRCSCNLGRYFKKKFPIWIHEALPKTYGYYTQLPPWPVTRYPSPQKK